MRQSTARVNPSEETIKIGPLGIRFLLTGDDSNGSVSVFEVLVPVGQKLAAPSARDGPRTGPLDRVVGQHDGCRDSNCSASLA